MNAIPLATYRIQLQPDFGFEVAASVLDYLARLGVSHLYCAPYLQAAPRSPHGYDVVNYWRINTDLGGAEGYRVLRRALEDNRMGQILDIVPNHMAISGRENVWWWDVLENGQSSRYACYFDVEWEPVESRFGSKILLPILGTHFGRDLEAGEIRLSRSGGRFFVRYYEHEFPVAPESIALILCRTGETANCPELMFSLEQGGHLDEDFFSRLTGMEVALGPTFFRKPFHFGNVLLSRLPLSLIRRIDLSTHPYEPRGAIDATVAVGTRMLRVLSAHLGLRAPERKFQTDMLLKALGSDYAHPAVIMGDFNEWSPGSWSIRKLCSLFCPGRSPRSFPSLLPLFPLDRILVKPSGLMKEIRAHRSPEITLASDHLPVTADIAL